MYVVKRDGRKEPVHFDKITERITKLLWGLSPEVDPCEVAKKVCGGVYKGVSTRELDELAAETSAHMITLHPDYGKLAARIEVSNLHKHTDKQFSKVAHTLYRYVNPHTGKAGPLISSRLHHIIQHNKEQLDQAVINARDYSYGYFGIKTLIRSYLLKINGAVAERPQHMLMRVALGIHHEDIAAALETYELMSKGWFTHASPTLFNAGTPRPQLSSCFLVSMKEDSIEGIYDTLKQCAQISKHAGGIGIAVSTIRARGAYIRGTNGTSNGLVPMLRVFNNTARYVDQGGGKRKGSFAVYLEPWHADIMAFLELRKNHGNEEERARDLFLALWVPDLFMQRVEQDGEWSLMCPDECPGLDRVWGEQFEELYEKYERESDKVRKKVKARQVWQAVLQSQIETGTPYVVYKDACNRKSNQKELGTIRCSNLCTEIVQYSDSEEVAVCNLASIALPKFVENEEGVGGKGGGVDLKRLKEVAGVVTRNLNRVIDVNYYPLKEAERSNRRHRPIGIGVQGLADVFLKVGVAFDSEEARRINKEVFEAIYYGAVEASCELARKEGSYESFEGSPASKGLLQFDLWREEREAKHGEGDKENREEGKEDVDEEGLEETQGERWDWKGLKEKVVQYGLRNSLLVAPMPTASTSQILGNNECFEPYTSNAYVRRTLAGEFVCINEHLIRELIKRGKWNEEMREAIVAHNGSVQHIPGFPQELKPLYKTVWEISQRALIDMAVDRAHYIDQSQSFNIHMAGANFAKLTSMHFYGWKKGLKTGMYYLRTKAAVDAVKVTVRNEQVQRQKEIMCSLDNREECMACGS